MFPDRISSSIIFSCSVLCFILALACKGGSDWRSADATLKEIASLDKTARASGNDMNRARDLHQEALVFLKNKNYEAAEAKWLEAERRVHSSRGAAWKSDDVGEVGYY